MKTRKGEKEKLKRVILEKTVAYLKRHGRSGAGTEQIMSYAGLTRGALYSHFKSKDDLFAQAVCYDLERLEEILIHRFHTERSLALSRIIEDHLSEKSLTNIENSCVFTSLSSDMQRCKTVYRAQYESIINRLLNLFADMLKTQFPGDSREELLAKASNLYSGLVGTLTMARTVNNRKQAMDILNSGKSFLTENFLNQKPD